MDSLAGWVFGLTLAGELSPELRPRADRLALGFAAALRGPATACATPTAR